jgi:hypothetical protein
VKKAILFIGVLLALGVGVVVWILGHRLPGVWTTDSPLEQGGLRLMAIQPNQPRDWGGAGSEGTTKVGYQTAWFEIAPETSSDDKTRIQFHMVDRDGNDELLWEVDDGSYGLGERHFASVDIPLCYGPEFAGSTLEAYAKGKRIGAWKLSGMPVLPKQIGDDEKDVLTAEALGYRFTADAPFKSLYRLREGRRTQWSLQAHVKIAPTGDDDGKDRMEVLTGATRTTWGTDSSSHSIADPRTRDLAGVGIGLPFTSSTKRAEVTITIRRYRVLDEPVVFRDIHAESRSQPGEKPVGTFNALVTSAQSVKTPSGLTITLPESEFSMFTDKDSLCFRLNCSQGSKDLILPNSPLYRTTKKPVSIEFVYPDGSSLPCATDIKNEGNWSAAYKIPGDRRMEPFVMPELKIMVRQKVILEEKTVKLLAPVVQEEFKPILKTGARLGKS